MLSPEESAVGLSKDSVPCGLLFEGKKKEMGDNYGKETVQETQKC